mmetsp:Transcript_28022/g.82035  ORF Transcript_28022/g.82035 Transcript_28022/m.82035 type:complete len:321 (-) Transcript_28022:1032-1994(-)
MMRLCGRLLPLGGLLLAGAQDYGVREGSAAERPNIIFILADDQSTMLDSLEHMPKLRRLVVEEGVDVQNTFAATPVCCPSRSSIYTGRYIHNIGVYNNSAGSGGCSSLRWQEGPEKSNVAFHLQQLGYATSFAGKYMNNYGYGTSNAVDSLPQCLNRTMAQETSDMDFTCAQRLEYVPPGWSNWQALRGNSVYYNYTLSNNGVPEQHGDDYAEDYLVDLVKNRWPLQSLLLPPPACCTCSFHPHQFSLLYSGPGQGPWIFWTSTFLVASQSLLCSRCLQHMSQRILPLSTPTTGKGSSRRALPISTRSWPTTTGIGWWRT